MKRINIYSVKQVRESSGLYDVDNAKIQSPETADKIIRLVLDLNNEAVEKFGIITLNTKNAVAGIHVISMGDLNTSIVHPREIFKAAILNNACSIILFHNHPSGDTAPSGADVSTTKKLVNAGELMGIKVLDHIIVGDKRFTSLKEKGLM
jgi:DNA repair protein RadC